MGHGDNSRRSGRQNQPGCVHYWGSPADGTQQCQNHAEKVSDRDQKGGQVNDERRHKNHDQKGCPECPDDSPVGVVQVKGRIAAVVCPCQRQGREQRDQGSGARRRTSAYNQ